MAVLSICTVSIGIGLTFYLYQTFYVDNQRDLLLLQGRNLEKVYEEHGEGESLQSRLDWSSENSDAEVIFTQNPMELSASLPYDDSLRESLISFEERQKLLRGETVTMVRKHPMFDQDILAVAIPLLDGEVLEGAIFLYKPLEDVYGPFEGIRYILAGSMVLLLFLVIWMGRKIANQLVMPLKKMEMVSEKMAGGDFSKRIYPSSSDEVGSLAESFNRLAKYLEEEESNRREFLQNVSHELRTPLSYMRGYTEAIMDGLIQDEEEKEKYIRITHQETARLSRLVNDLLDLAQLEGDSYPMNLEPIPFAQLIYDVVERFKLRIEQKRISIILQLDEEAIIEGDADRLEQVVSNLLDNAIRYTHEADQILINIKQINGKTVLTISDTGRGIPKEDLENIMDRFYRVQKSRTREEGGSGLGLAVVKQIIQKHNAEINIQSEAGKGTSVMIEFDTMIFDE
ncbi:cell wall metabolism sensor histidine kinase WalK [Halobacillus sp. A1]|uniref:sensor histidine kinase n=1 Tax=Halobacillus sp. A1 TaxID=2880262 RepID=UPI0020A693FC|nr:ATP-binding protein [Halobacillus sp. A1]MCP3033342.1 cell wall metabolism sensor histidine kinase WalK [Halobacillus sp. A1]